MVLPPHDEWMQGTDAGPHAAPVGKLLLHTTEGTSIKGACASYAAKQTWPHLTVDCLHGHPYTRCGHLDLGVAARSLQNLSGGVETNRAGVIQIEVVGFASQPADIDWGWLGANVVGPICRQTGIPISSTVAWVAYPASYGLNAPQRLSGAAWSAYRGLLGHQHCPENNHGDPGRIDIQALLDAAAPPPPEPARPEDDDEMHVLYHPNDTFWLVADSGATQISADTYHRYTNAGFKAVAPEADQADAIINGTLAVQAKLDQILEKLGVGNDQRQAIKIALVGPQDA